MSSLTEEQRKMIEEKKKVAQAKLAAKFSQRGIPVSAKSNNNQCTLSNTGMVIQQSPIKKTVHINYNNTPQNCNIKPIRGKCELISKDRFIVHVAYHKQLIDIFKTIQSKNYSKSVLLYFYIEMFYKINS